MPTAYEKNRAAAQRVVTMRSECWAGPRRDFVSSSLQPQVHQSKGEEKSSTSGKAEGNEQGK